MNKPGEYYSKRRKPIRKEVKCDSPQTSGTGELVARGSCIGLTSLVDRGHTLKYMFGEG